MLAGSAAVLVLAGVSVLGLTALSTREDLGSLFVDPATDAVAETAASALASGDTRTALRAISDAVSADVALLPQARALAYTIGRLSVGHYGTVPSAFQACDSSFLNGCTTGVLHEHVLKGGALTPAVAISLCRYDVLPTDPGAPVACVRGVGAALFFVTAKNLSTSLGLCDALAADQRLQCYSGVFAANTDLLVQHLTEDQAREPHSHVSAIPSGPLLRAEDPHYPCSSVAPRYQVACYALQPWPILVLHDHEPARALAMCASAPMSSRAACFSGLGQNLAGPSRDALGTLGGCSAVESRYREFCFAGALTALVNTEQLSQACPSMPESDKTACYAGFGTHVARMYPQTAARQAACEKVESGHRAACIRGSQTLPAQD